MVAFPFFTVLFFFATILWIAFVHEYLQMTGQELF